MILSQKLLRDFKLLDFRFAQFMETVSLVVRLFDAFPTFLSPVRLREVAWIDKSPPSGHGVIHDVVDLSQLPLLRLIIQMRDCHVKSRDRCRAPGVPALSGAAS